MWNQMLKLAARFWRIAEDNDRNRSDIAALREEVQALWRAVDRLQGDVRHNAECERHEREKLILGLQNELLRFERRLPPPRKA
jgi:hypothetical protein